MGATNTKKAGLTSYQLKDVAHFWYKMWQDSRALGGGPITWKLFKTAFLEIFFPREMREAKVDDFINLKQGLMNVSEYSLKFVKLSRNYISLVSNYRDEMSRFLTGMSEELEEDCRATMLQDSINLSRLMAHVQQVEGSRKKRKVREGHQSLGNSNSQRSATPRGDKLELKKGNGGDVQRPRKECGKCDLIHSGECRLGTNACFGCGKSEHGQGLPQE
ncbi:uncharacterized protein [Solanum lycopersicum]|uniref:uncharacterized protein n=1 Tax=Solanum lycopersicum TaxID=4081 RepID=UPI0002BC9948|nr:uncharacterized protein LOC101264056 [Solanum lycopersicum]